MKKTLPASFAVATVLGLAACNGSDSHSPIGTGQFRVVNAIADSQPIDATVDNITTGSTNNTGYQADSGFVDVPDGSYKVQISATPQGGGGAVTFTVDNVSIDHNNQTTVYAIGKLGNSSQTGVAVEENVGDAIPSGQVDLQFVNAASTAAISGTVYLLTPGGQVSSPVYSAPLTQPVVGSTSFYSQPTPQTGGSYEVVIQVAGLTIYDSGATTGINFPSGGNFQIAILDATGAQVTSNVSPVVLDILNNSDGSQAIYLAGSNGVAAGGGG